MAIFERSLNYKIITKSIGVASLIAVVIFFILMVAKAGELSSITTSATTQVTFGPLKLMELTKQPLDGGGYQASMRFMSGIVVYFLVWILAGLAYGIYKIRKFSNILATS